MSSVPNNFGQTNKGLPSAKLSGGRGWRTYLKIRLIALFESQGFSDTEIAFALKITPQYVRNLKNTPEYVSAKVTAATNVLSQAEKEALNTIEARQAALKDMVPDALHAIRDTLMNSNNPALRLKAAQDLLDREGTLAKVSRTEVSLPKEHDFEQHKKATDNLLTALQSLNIPKQEDEQNKLAEENQSEDALATQGIDEFVNTSINEDQQKLMQDAMNLISDSVDKEIKTQKYVQ